MRDQGCLHQSDRGLVHGATHDIEPGLQRAASAVGARSPIDIILHSDRGGKFRSRAFATTLRNAGLHGSMGRVGSAVDNAAMESSFALLQNNVLKPSALGHPRATPPSDPDLD